MNAGPPCTESPSRPTPNLLVKYRVSLRSPDARTRRDATKGLADLGASAEPLVRRALLDTDPEVRVAGAEAVCRIGALGIQEQLLELLESEYPDVRDYAARRLGVVGDERALAPLIEAFYRGVGRFGRWHKPLGLLRVACLLGSLFGALYGLQFRSSASFGNLLPLVVYGCSFLEVRRSRRVPGELLNALIQVAERHPSPELKSLLPDLRAVANDRLQFDGPARDASRAAAERIEALSPVVPGLPLPSGAPTSGCESLPVPSTKAPDQRVTNTAGTERVEP